MEGTYLMDTFCVPEPLFVYLIPLQGQSQLTVCSSLQDVVSFGLSRSRFIENAYVGPGETN